MPPPPQNYRPSMSPLRVTLESPVFAQIKASPRSYAALRNSWLASIEPRKVTQGCVTIDATQNPCSERVQRRVKRVTRPVDIEGPLFANASASITQSNSETS